MCQSAGHLKGFHFAQFCRISNWTCWARAEGRHQHTVPAQPLCLKSCPDRGKEKTVTVPKPGGGGVLATDCEVREGVTRLEVQDGEQLIPVGCWERVRRGPGRYHEGGAE